MSDILRQNAASPLLVMQALRCMAPALPVIAGKPAPTGVASAVEIG
jgi:hypothetical protein